MLISGLMTPRAIRFRAEVMALEMTSEMASRAVTERE